MNDREHEPRDTQIPLRYDPLDIFRESATPAGLDARQKWLGESGASVWQKDFHEIVFSLYHEKASRG